tara:strand:+ start:200 stop:424 length:225 start_codon:yes stop_codon:yes gene_type:complete
MNNKELKKLITDVVYDTVQFIKDDNVIYMYEPTLETHKDSNDNVHVYIEHHKAFIDESYIIDTIFDNLKEKDNE